VKAREFVLSNAQAAWHYAWDGGRLRALRLENRLSGATRALTAARELALVFSAAGDRVAETLRRVEDFTVVSVRLRGKSEAAVELKAAGVAATLHLRLEGPTRRKWVEVTNTGRSPALLLDVELDDFIPAGSVEGGGEGQPVFVDDEIFAAVEHPCGTGIGEGGRVRLAHYPGWKLAPGGRAVSRTALVSVAPAGGARAHFVSYIEARSVRPRKALSLFTPFGFNNQWGSCPTLDDEQNLNVLDRLDRWRRRGVKFDYYTLDTGWVDFNSDLTRFRPNAFPEGPDAVIRRVRGLGMKFGLWFATGWGAQSCWDYGPAFADGKPGKLPYREGYPAGGEGVWFCFGEERYQRILRNAVLHHVRENHVRLLKFDGGSYRCDHTGHGHLPGKYSVEPMFDALIDIAESARAVAPDIFIMWYWGLSSPFWAMHGDMIFESGLKMEGSATSAYPALYYRDSVSIALDQNTRCARNIPPTIKDSLGLWLSDTRWGNFMGRERWREALVMDLGRGNLLFPNIWGNPFHLDDDDVDFLAWIAALAKKEARLLGHRRSILGDPFRNELYGYAHGKGLRAFLFLNNAHFTSRRAVIGLDAAVGLGGRVGTPLEVRAHFPDRARLRRPDGKGFRLGDVLDLNLRPFETLMLEIGPASRSQPRLPVRRMARDEASRLGQQLDLRPAALTEDLEMTFTDAAAFAQKNLVKKSLAFEAALPAYSDGPPMILGIAIRLRKGNEEWLHTPTVVQIVQALVKIGGRSVILTPVPDGRQHGNTQSFGSSWVLYKTRLSSEWSGAPVRLAVHANLPADVEARVEAWVVRRWWREDTRPVADGCYTYAPS
jgi:hypothetical protein